MSTETVVIFLFDTRGEYPQPFALFPELPGDMNPRTCLSYAHIGQHSPADCLSHSEYSRPATPAEYASLLRELQNIGYNVKIAKRATRAMFDKRCKEINR